MPVCGFCGTTARSAHMKPTVSLAVWCNASAIVYGASIAETAATGKARILVSAEEVVAKSPAMVEIIGGVLREECLQLYA